MGEEGDRRHEADGGGEVGAEQDFARLLATFRSRAGVSQNALARMVGADASYLNRLERAQREPPRRELVESLATALGLRPEEADRLLVAAGHLPRALAALGPLDPTVALLADVLADEAIPAAERSELREIVRLIARRWRPHA